MEERSVALCHPSRQLHHYPHAKCDEAARHHARDDAQHDHLLVLVTILVVSGPTYDLWVTLYCLISIRVRVALQRREGGGRN